MQSLEIVLVALAVMLFGALALYYQFTGTRRFETAVAFCGVALVACGFAMLQDGVMGSRKFLWMLPSARAIADTPIAGKAAGQPYVRYSAVFQE